MTEFAGTLKQRIAIERPITTRTPTGVQESGWEAIASCLAAIELEGVGPRTTIAEMLAAMRQHGLISA
jgi:hypothetical protein